MILSIRWKMTVWSVYYKIGVFDILFKSVIDPTSFFKLISV